VSALGGVGAPAYPYKEARPTIENVHVIMIEVVLREVEDFCHAKGAHGIGALEEARRKGRTNGGLQLPVSVAA
jgi:hypothetical protein